ncbi:hypothetical protein VTN96DRAFT_2780 [Rasamsonia emersonii]|uniref:Uncharacterized protein n=1 Tax=Rasamsonia emersonii (strain ATCC 16479 / CBS 393.64 / IMI 116815) TaxID=1408163 RepID=A0A0F4YEW9_RASE3|nr:hypothetical protein T310_9867 [Rasamsonia emersonii CBS 393.64]KKA16521.1 hypothetical protein T310_9867 [Rasamsonia emersonii CBS 393.64]
MVSFVKWTLSVLLLFLCLFGDCWITPLDSPATTPALSGWRLTNRALLARQDSDSCTAYLDDPDVPDCGPLCGPSNLACTQAPLDKRNRRIFFGPEPGAWNETDPSPEELKTLQKRTITPLLQNQLADYLIDQFQGNPDPYFGTPSSIADPSDNVVRQELFGNTPFQVGTNGLCGCTVVTVVSTRAVYMGHFFEVPSWSSSASVFKQRVLNFFSGGGQVGQGPAMNPDLFTANDDTRVYVMTPRSARGNYQNYQNSNYYGKVPRLLNTIRTALGNQDVPIAVWNYIPLECEIDGETNDELFESERGVALFQFDPDAFGSGVRGWRILYEALQFLSTDPAPGAESASGVPDP